MSAGRLVNELGSVTRIGRLLEEQGAHRVLIVTDPGLASTGIVDQVASSISARGLTFTLHAEIPANPSTASLEVAAAAARECDADYVVGLGGGSALDAAKAVALVARTPLSAAQLADGASIVAPPLPVAAIPTTAGTGAETNGFAVMESAHHRKVYIGSESTVPSLVILDAQLTLGLPAGITAASGFDAIVHGVESLISRGATTTSRAYACESLRLTTSALATAVADGSDMEARRQMMTGAHLAGLALTLSGLGLVHGIAHSITATTGTPHGRALACIVGPALTFGADAAPARYRDLAGSLGLDASRDDAVDQAVQRVADLAVLVGLPPGLDAAGVSVDMIDTIVRKTLEDPVTRNTPRRPSDEELSTLLHSIARRG
ncbi:MAG TPA: iron-containing alcohol dehydrogenase [Nocardioidaceae bacterium]|nr:iron-containing alcohol dehydrogenase [Nocardioidaceae bacterium]